MSPAHTLPPSLRVPHPPASPPLPPLPVLPRRSKPRANGSPAASPHTRPHSTLPPPPTPSPASSALLRPPPSQSRTPPRTRETRSMTRAAGGTSPVAIVPVTSYARKQSQTLTILALAAMIRELPHWSVALWHLQALGRTLRSRMLVELPPSVVLGGSLRAVRPGEYTARRLCPCVRCRCIGKLPPLPRRHRPRHARLPTRWFAAAGREFLARSVSRAVDRVASWITRERCCTKLPLAMFCSPDIVQWLRAGLVAQHVGSLGLLA